jgi:hypothetical protein
VVVIIWIIVITQSYFIIIIYQIVHQVPGTAIPAWGNIIHPGIVDKQQKGILQ